ncbi:hypothetical protein HPB50_000747 [Hyalomma asiaticum]|uniref:Uncharacterized protein n=1 Tax=Hyalomma asiaticum TaxID=266040 RepID=A0ACB7SS23_HYAAI|nr:hypothetical protein HPB50_000747 [Hyalomma asiaticum]
MPVDSKLQHRDLLVAAGKREYELAAQLYRCGVPRVREAIRKNASGHGRDAWLSKVVKAAVVEEGKRRGLPSAAHVSHHCSDNVVRCAPPVAQRTAANGRAHHPSPEDQPPAAGASCTHCEPAAS